MTISIHQPAYNPWLGYINKISLSDLFIFLDTVQFEKNSFINRNKIKTPQGTMWLTIPVQSKNHLNKKLNEIEIDYKQNWIKVHLKSIELNYKKAKNYEIVYEFWEDLLKRKYQYLSDLCFDQLNGIVNLLGNIDTQIIKSSSLDIEGENSDLILNICKMTSADKYISGILGKDYLQLEDFNKESIKVIFQNFKHPYYKQLWGDFQPCIGVLDYLMNMEKIKL